VNANGDVVQCNQDDIWTLMSSNLGKTACSQLFSSPNATVTVLVTSTQYELVQFLYLHTSNSRRWTTDITATVDITSTQTIQDTSATTVTITETGVMMRKRHAQPAPATTATAVYRRAASLQESLEEFQDSGFNSTLLLEYAPQIASACSCLDSGPLFTTTVDDVVATTVRGVH
jgi:hypothetical protein